jgi:cytochrome oxidase Cu insertion factor (SCO1/SenC/PrrC family)
MKKIFSIILISLSLNACDKLNTMKTLFSESSPTTHLSDVLPDGYPRTDKPAMDFSLIDQTGRKITLSQLKGKFVLLGFVYAHCKTMCPMTIHDLKEAQTMMSVPSEVLMVTMDPASDTPDNLPAMAKDWGLSADVHILSGPIDDVKKVLKDCAMLFEKDAAGDIGHAGLTYIIDPSGQITYTLNHASSVTMLDAVKKSRK